MFLEQLSHVQQRKPLIHCITNFVTANDCANLLLACNASPIMAEDASEVEEITALSQGLAINLGTLHKELIPSMLLAGQKAVALGHPVLLDPVGAGASKLRTQTAQHLIKEIPFRVIRGNLSELKALSEGKSKTKGVDADASDALTKDSLEATVDFAKRFSAVTGAIIAISGAIDVVADVSQAYCITNGHPMMRRVTGTGCMLSAMITAYLAANPDSPLEATAAAVCAMGICGEMAYQRMTPLDGNATYRNYLIDAVYLLTPEELERSARYEMR